MNTATIACTLTASAAKRQSPEWAMENTTVSTHLPALVHKIEATILRAESMGLHYSRGGVPYSSLATSNEKYYAFMGRLEKLNHELRPLGVQVGPVNGQGPLALVLA